MDLLADLTPAQREAVTTTEGPLLVLAGAGSGKTRVITRRIAYLMSQGVRAQNILALTFTNKAAGEMKSRVEALAPGQHVWMGTFHSLCARLLRTYAPLLGLPRGFTIYDQADRLRTIRAAMSAVDLEGENLSPARVEAAISRAKNDLPAPGPIAAWRDSEALWPALDRIYAAYQERLRDSAAVDFDDLLLLMVRVLKDHPDVRAQLDARFRYVLVDEYQDTNIAQYAIVRALSVDYPNLCATGDPDQSIYGWRGANLNNILEFEHDFPGCHVVKLERNYRSTKNILHVGDYLIRFNRKRKPKSLHTENERGLPVVLSVYANEQAEAQGVASKIKSLVENEGYSYRDIAVFCRVTALTAAFETALRAAGVPYQVIGGVSFYERQEVKDVLAYLSLLANPRDDLAVMRVINLPPRGLGKSALARLGEYAQAHGLRLLAAARQSGAVPGLSSRAAIALAEFAGLFDRLAQLQVLTAEEAIRRLLAQTGYRDYLAALGKGGKAGDEERLANVEELISEARRFDEANPGSSLLEFLERITLASSIDGWQAEAGAVALMTLHAAKGLEFPVVFITALEEGFLPHARSQGSSDELEEERRLLFVGITRAKRELYLSRCHMRAFRGSSQAAMPSSFLRELPEEPMEIHDQSAFSSSGVFTTFRGASPLPSARPGAPGGFHLTTAAALEQTGSNVHLDRFQPGLRVMHPEFGLGRIVSIEGAGAKRKGRVAFASGEKVFILAMSALIPIRER